LGKRAAPRASRTPRPGTALRGLLPDRNPLRRAADRFESFAVFALIIVFLAGAPLAGMAVGKLAYASAARIAHSQSAAWHRVTAVVLKDVPKADANPYGAADVQEVPASWIAPDGSKHTGQITAAPGTDKGSAVTIWTTGAGRQTGPPLQHPQVVDQAALAAFLTILGGGVGLLLSGVLIHRALDRRRLAAWGAAWATTGPLWSNYR
jgi:hypothetical protein